VRKNAGVIEFICEGGAGGEAKVTVELRTKFPGIGGTIITQEGVAAALRESYNRVPKSSHKVFLRHTIIKKLEDYFHRLERYSFAHIPRPLGSISRFGENACEAYIYEWAFGSDQFAWEYITSEGRPAPINLHDWHKFVEVFFSAGIDLQYDTVSSVDGRISQNIVHQYSIPSAGWSELNCLWKRIDFGENSIRIDYDKLLRFLHDEEQKLRQALRSERYEMLILAYEYLTKGERMDRVNIGRLDALVGDYRLSSLRHHISRGLGVSEELIAYMGARTESLL
jgi:hypothetical protein